MKSFLYLIGVLLLFEPIDVLAQDPSYSQFQSNQLDLNPAFAGYEGCSRVAMAYRNDHASIEGDNSNYRLSIDQYVHPVRGGIGLNVQYDHSSDVRNSISIKLYYSPVFGLFKRKLLISPALAMGWTRVSIDFRHLSFEDPFDPVTGAMYHVTNPLSFLFNSNYFDASLGVILSHHNLTYGFSVQHITEPEEGFEWKSRLPRKYTAHINYVGVVNERLKFSGTLTYQYQSDLHLLFPSLTVCWFGAKLGIGGTMLIVPADYHLYGQYQLALTTGYTYKFVSFSVGLNLTETTLKTINVYSASLNLQFRFNCKNKERGRKGTSMWGM